MDFISRIPNIISDQSKIVDVTRRYMSNGVTVKTIDYFLISISLFILFIFGNVQDGNCSFVHHIFLQNTVILSLRKLEFPIDILKEIPYLFGIKSFVLKRC